MGKLEHIHDTTMIDRSKRNCVCRKIGEAINTFVINTLWLSQLHYQQIKRRFRWASHSERWKGLHWIVVWGLGSESIRALEACCTYRWIEYHGWKGHGWKVDRLNKFPTHVCKCCECLALSYTRGSIECEKLAPSMLSWLSSNWNWDSQGNHKNVCRKIDQGFWFPRRLSNSP